MAFRFPRLTPAVKIMLIICGATFVVEALLQQIGGLPVFQWLALDPTPGPNWLWQPLTYVFVYPPTPDALLSLGLSLLFVWLMMSPFEERYGAKRTWQLAAAGVIGAAIPVVLLGLVLTAREPVFGPGILVLASLGAFAITIRGGEVLLFFVVPMKAWHLIALGLGFSALLAVLAQNPFLFAFHAGALGAGVGFAKWMTRPRRRPPGKGKGKGEPRRKGGPSLRVVRGGASDDDPPRWLN